MVCKGASVLLIFAFVAILGPVRLSANPLPWVEEDEDDVAVQNSGQSPWQQAANEQDEGQVLESVGSATKDVERTDAPAEGQESPSGTPARADEAAVLSKDPQEIVNGQDSTVDHQGGSEQGATDDDMARSYTVGDGYYGEPQQYEQTTNPYYEDQSRPDDYITYDGPYDEDPQYAPEYDDQVEYQDNTAYDRPDNYQDQYPDTYEEEVHYPEDEYQQSAYDSTPTYEHDGYEPAEGTSPYADPDYNDYQQPAYEGYPPEDEQESYGYDNDDYREERYPVDEVEHPYTPGYGAGAYENQEEHTYDSQYDRRDTGLQYNMYDDTYYYGRYLEDEYYG